ncbi:MAG: glycosyl hydrolase [Verrucomicrobiae bacterium]|nr:glycosyl hydrolase [Verrucomicrobiae bacterium]
MRYSWRKEFAIPSNAYRAKPFWSWNGKLEEQELRRQIRLMGQMGFGGFFMHSRTGLATPYLSAEWFKLVGDSIDEAARCGMEAWLYDEDRWPSGTAGGLVTRKPQFQMKFLKMTVQPFSRNLKLEKELIAVFAAKLNLEKISAVERQGPNALPGFDPAGKKKLVFCTQSPSPADFYNGYTYVDVLNPKAIKEFIRVTHEGYRQYVGAGFGKTIPGIFTDEPTYFHSFNRNQSEGGYLVPWTGALPEVFKRRHGYDLLNHLPELFFLPEGVEFSRVRYHFIDCITWMFTESFSRQISRWCDRNKLLFTGHVLAEDTVSFQTSRVGSAMRFYEHMHAPGMDMLTEHWRTYDTAKQVSSAARQFGRKWRLTETDGCTGWDFSFAGHKALGDWQVALGINVRCPHLSWYTMEGEAKRDYPASIFYQSPWWRDYRMVEDYFARIHAVMTRGEEVRDLLVILPVESLWGECRIGEAGWVNDPSACDRQCDRQVQKIRDALLSNHIDFDYGDEDIMSRHGKVIAGSEAKLMIGKAAYKAVLVPPLVTIRSSTLILLSRFRSAGGRVVFLEQPPKYVDALLSQKALEFSRQCVVTANRAMDFIPLLEDDCRRISIVDEHGKEIPSVLCLLRRDHESDYLFLCNTGHSRSQFDLPQMSDVAVAKRKAAFDLAFIRGFGECQGRPIELEPSSGKMLAANAVRKDGLWEIQTSFPALGSRLFVIPRRKTRCIFPEQPALKTIKRVRMAQGWWPIVLSENNCLVLDRPHFKIGNSAWKGPEEILRADGKVRDAIGLKRRGGEMIQPWAQNDRRLAQETLRATVVLEGKPGCMRGAGGQAFIELKYEFEIETLPSGDVFLAVERPDLYAITVNDMLIETDMDCGWWVDRSLRKMPLPSGALKTGRNEIKLACKYTARHPGFEMIYLLGAFGVRLRGGKGCLTDMPRFLRLGDWCRQGLPFYSGSVGYSCRIRSAVQPGQRIVLNVPEFSGMAVKVWVDGSEAGYAAWPPWQVDITQMLDNENRQHELRIEVLGHRRNSHGPLHHINKHPIWTGPAEFISKNNLWSEDYQLVSCGLHKPPELLTFYTTKIA